MSRSLADHLADYLALRRGLGFKLERAEKLLGQFIAYLDELDEPTITTAVALRWAGLPKAPSTSWLSQRLSAVRGFTAYLQSIEVACEVPGPELLPSRSWRAVPYIYSVSQIKALFEATEALTGRHRTATYKTLVGLLWVSGMRVGEAIRLDRVDLDRRTAALTVRNTKFGKSRELPLDPSVVEALDSYLRRGDRPPAKVSEAMFVSTAGTRLLYSNVQHTFAGLLYRAGIRSRSARCRPRIHDLRHSFATHTILAGYRAGKELDARLAALSTYLGHVDPGRTYWYLSATPELMGLAATRLEQHLGAAR